jgi:hypothetical protein
MYIKINSKQVKLVEYSSFKERFKSLKFNFNKLDYAIKYPKKRFFNTIFFVQNVDIVLTDKEEKVVGTYENVRSEKYFIHKKKTYNVYLLPLGSVKHIAIGDIIKTYNKK